MEQRVSEFSPLPLLKSDKIRLAVAAVGMLMDAGIPVNRIKLLAVLASMPGLQKILRECPGLEIYVAAVDQELTKEGMISPGLGGELVPLLKTKLIRVYNRFWR